MIRMLQRICWNTRSWRMPTGNSSDGGYPSQNGFGHEEWNFQLEDAFENYVYAYVYFTPSQRTIRRADGVCEIGFWTIHPDTHQKLLVGFYHEASLSPANSFPNLFTMFNRSGILRRRAEELTQAVPRLTIQRAVAKIGRAIRAGDYKFRCPIGQVEVLEEYRPLPDTINGKRIMPVFSRPTFVESFDDLLVTPVREFHQIQARQTPLAEDAYYRENARNLRVIIPRHNQLSNAFCDWLRTQGVQNPVQERNQVDVWFETETSTYLAELKVCYGIGTTKAIRESLGQLLEYNFYRQRTPAEKWLIVLDEQPSQDDKNYVGQLKQRFSFPLGLVWRSGDGFQLLDGNWIQ